MVFTLLLIVIPIFLIVLLEVILRIANYSDDLSLFVSTPDESSKFYGVNLHVGQRYFYYFGDQYDPTPQKDLFLKEKPENDYRIFALGASTTAGFPFGGNVSFPRILHRYLAETFPDRHVEVINTAITSINSYALLDFIDEILEQSPDAILIYAGHNEYYGPFGPAAKVSFGSQRNVVRLLLHLQRFKSYILFRNVIGSGIRNLINSQEPTQQINSEFKAKTYVPMGSRKYQAGLNQFERNLDGIIRKCKKAGVPLVLSELVSNIRDQKPFDSVSSDSLPMAETFFSEARDMEKAGKYDEARKAYLKAKDLDPIRFRAPEAFNDIVRHLGKKYDVPVVSMTDYFRSVSPHGLIGNNIILEHVHPTLEGYFLMADAFYETMHRLKFINSERQNYIPEPSSHFMSRWGYTELDSIYAELVTQNLTNGWPFNKKTFSTISGEYLLSHFNPQTKIDSIALAASTNREYSIQVGHLDLGKYYEENGELDKALSEYKTLIYTIPTMDMFYQLALRIYLKRKQYKQANQLMKDAIKYNKSAFTYKWLGQTSLMLNNIKDGIEYLEKSYTFDSSDRQVLFNLTRAYYSILDFSNGDKILKKYQEYYPNDAGIDRLKIYRQTVSKVYEKLG